MNTVADGPGDADAGQPPKERHKQQPLRQCVKHALNTYFKDLNGHNPGKLYELVLSEIEQPLLEVVMNHTRGNISKAAQLLGLNRATLRKKLKKYSLDLIQPPG
jgi:Fis family transcriptional regulator